MNKMKFIKHFQGVFITLLLCPAMLWAGITGKISGRVTNAETGDPLPGANVIIVGTTLGASADAEGDYFVINIPPGTYSVEATMIGYQGVTKTGAIVRIDLTTPVDFNLTSAVIAGEAVTVTAEREIIKMDQSASAVHASIAEIEILPLVTDIQQYIALQAGIEGDIIRGGGLDQTAFMLDGMMVVDNRSNQPLITVNLSSIKELSVIKGGFNAEYGNVRSGLINIITKDGDPDRYHASADIRYTPAQLKHGGPSLMNWKNYYMRPYLDPDVMWLGTNAGDSTYVYDGTTYTGKAWDKEKQDSYKYFEGWVSVAERIGVTPEEARDIFTFRHASEGSGKLGQKEKTYGDQPDWYGDVSLSGPVPVIGQYLGDLAFFVSHTSNRELFATPQPRDYYQETNTQLKLTSRLTPAMKLTLEGFFGEVQSVDRHGNNNYYKNGKQALTIFEGGSSTISTVYFLGLKVPIDVSRNMQGLSLEHVLSPKTFYTLKLSRVNIQNLATDFLWRDSTTIATIGGIALDEAPWGYWWEGGARTDLDNWSYYAGLGGPRDSSSVSTLSAQFDITSQVNKYHQVKVGFNYVSNDLFTRYENIRPDLDIQNWRTEWGQSPSRLGAYIQDKLEFEGMVANFGLRLDVNNPNTDWYMTEKYSKYFKASYKYDLTELADTEPAKGKVKISPRLGISHPISETAKIYFNYGHFYSMPTSTDMYGIEYGSPPSSISFLGNPSAELPKTVAYELGYEQNVAQMFLVHLSGYYKDVGDQTARVAYENYDGSIWYETIENTNYADIRGFELTINKPFGRWFTAWLNYNYMVTTEGYVGRRTYYEDPIAHAKGGLQEPKQERPLARPILRANLTVHTPAQWGPMVAGMHPLSGVSVSLLYQWKAGDYVTWDPLETYELIDNLQWKGEGYLDLRASKRVSLGDFNFNLYVDIRNVLDQKFINPGGPDITDSFIDDEDRRNYYSSLHLPMYEGPEYEGFTAGDDKLGDIKSKDKPYINMPDREFLTYLNPRYMTLGMTFNF